MLNTHIEQDDQKIAPAFSLNGTITPPPDKSISQRAAIFALLHDGKSVIKNYSPAEDPQSTLNCVELLGAEVTQLDDVVVVEGRGRYGIQPLSDELDCGNSGTAMRLLSGVLVGSGSSVYLIGDPSLSARTMKRIIDPLESMGAHILARNGKYAPLFVTREDPFVPIDFELPIPSAQLKSCILLAGLFGETPTRVIETVPSRDHTERLLNLEVEVIDGKRVISASLKNKIPNQSYTIRQISLLQLLVSGGIDYARLRNQVGKCRIESNSNRTVNHFKTDGRRHYHRKST